MALTLFSVKVTVHFSFRLFTVPYIFVVRSLRYTASYRHRYLDFQMYRGGGRRGLWLWGGGGGREKQRDCNNITTARVQRVRGTSNAGI